MTASISLEPDASSCRIPEEARASAHFEALYNRHVAFVWRAVRSLGVPQEAVADVVQEVFLQVYRHLEQWGGSGSERAWLFAFVRRTVANHRRGRRRRPGGDPIDDDFVHGGLGPDALAERQEASRILLAGLESLDEVSREHVVLVDLEMLSVPEAAEALGQNVNTTYTRLRAARLKLRDVVTALMEGTRSKLPSSLRSRAGNRDGDCSTGGRR